MRRATLRLFNAIQVENKDVKSRDFINYIENGFMIHPSISLTGENLKDMRDIVGITGDRANASFHKSWSVVQEASIEQLVIQQIVHYMTTYGFESLGVYSDNTVYIPNEKLEVPELKEGIQLTLINALTGEEILERIIKLGSGVALSKSTLNDIMTIVKHNNYSMSIVNSIENRELKGLLFDYYGIVPTEPVEYLRYVINKMTGESLLIKNSYLIEKIKSCSSVDLDKLLTKAPRDLGKIFLRYKPLFLAMKKISKNKSFFNRLRKDAKIMHKPIGEDFLNSVTANIKKGTLDLNMLGKKLKDASIFRKVRLANSLQYRLNSCDSIVYKVRNGKGWVEDFSWDNSKTQATATALGMVMYSIAEDIRENVEGKTFYIPENVNYTVPATEKQFTGMFPSGSYVEVPKDMIAGINWHNVGSSRIDLDLSLVGESGKIGWDSSYRTDDRQILFSGDVTDASGKNGASESFLVKKGLEESKLIRVNDFTSYASPETPLKCKLFVGQEDSKVNLRNNYMVDPNKIIATANYELTKRDVILGLMVNVGDMNRFYFNEVSTGNKITSSCSDEANKARTYLIRSCQESISLNDILAQAGAVVVSEVPEEGEYTDLSPKNLTKDSIIGLLVK